MTEMISDACYDVIVWLYLICNVFIDTTLIKILTIRIFLVFENFRDLLGDESLISAAFVYVSCFEEIYPAKFNSFDTDVEH